jgi:hypothetical protein
MSILLSDNILSDNGILLVTQNLPVGNTVLGTEQVNVTVTQQFRSHASSTLFQSPIN